MGVAKVHFCFFDENPDWHLLIKIAFRHSEKIHFLFSLLSYLFSGKVARGEI